MKAKGFRICRVGGVDVFVDYSWIGIFFLLAYSFVEAFSPKPLLAHDRLLFWTMGAVASALTFFSILFHELAHSLVAIKMGVKLKYIRLFIFGGIAKNASEPRNGRDELLIALVGPAASILLGVNFVFLYSATIVYPSPVSLVFKWAAIANLILAFLNLIPGFPFDGGRILRAFLWDNWNDMARATQAVNRSGDIFVLFLIIFGVLQTIISRDYLFGIWCVCIGLIMKWALRDSLQVTAASRGAAPPRVAVRQIMKKNPITVDWLLTVNQFAEDYMYKYFFTEFPVLDRNKLVGMVTMAELITVPARLRNFKQIRDIMVPLEQVVSAGPEDDVNRAFEKMIEADADTMLVIEEGKLVGIIVRRDVVNYSHIKTFMEKGG